MSSILFCVADLEIKKDLNSWYTNKIGGRPDWMNSFESSWQALCDRCNEPQALVIQLYSCLSGSEHHRSIYIFSCLKKACWKTSKGWSVYRTLKVYKEENQQKSCIEQDEDLGNWDLGGGGWGDETDDWDEKECALTTLSKEDVIEEQMSKITLSEDIYKNINVVHCEQSPPQFSSYYINVYDEQSYSTSKTDDHVKQLEDQYNNSALQNEATSKQDNTYEKSTIIGKSLKSFSKCVKLCPEQVARYSYGGNPLYLDDKQELLAYPKCVHCGSKCVFEMQLMPALLPYLEHDKLNVEGDTTMDIEYGTVVVFTCENNCWSNQSAATSSHIFREQIMFFDDPDIATCTVVPT